MKIFKYYFYSIVIGLNEVLCFDRAVSVSLGRKVSL
jgi:hypothetical protein